MSLMTWLTILLALVEWGIRLGLAARVIVMRRSVPTSLAWITVLMLAPVVGVVAYLLIGENRLGRRRAEHHAAIVERFTRESIRDWKDGQHNWEDENVPYRSIATLATHVGGIPPLRGNRLELIGGTDEFLDRLIDDIDGAATRVSLLSYIMMRGGGGDRVCEALLRAAGRGVECRVLLDAVGSRPFLESPARRRLRERGVRVAPAFPVSPLRALFRRLDLRNHRKIAVIDGAIAYTGSHNVTDASFKLDPKTRVGPWIDASVRLQGPAVRALEVVFLHDWALDAPEGDISLEDFPADIDVVEEGSSVSVVPSMPGRDINAVYEAFVAAIYMARHELIMTTPYFVPDEAMRTALRAAVLRGVDVQIVIPAINDSPLVARASRAQCRELLEMGAAFWHFAGGLLHAKTLTIDRHVALIGSANFDVRSFWLNCEISLFVYDSDFASRLRFLQKSYIHESTRFTIEDWWARPAIGRFVDDVARLAGPVL